MSEVLQNVEFQHGASYIYIYRQDIQKNNNDRKCIWLDLVVVVFNKETKEMSSTLNYIKFMLRMSKFKYLEIDRLALNMIKCRN